MSPEDTPAAEAHTAPAVLVIDDDRFFQELCGETLRQEGYRVETAFTAEEALERIHARSFAIVLTDLVLPGMDGLALLGKIRQTSTDTDVIVMTGHATVESAVRALKAGASDYLTKPINPDELKFAVKRALEVRGLFDENTELRGLLTLYESCQMISHCLDVDELKEIALDAVIRATGAASGVALFQDDVDGEYLLKAARGMPEDAAPEIAGLLRDNSPLMSGGEMRVLDSLDAPAGWKREVDLSSGMVMPVTVDPEHEGAIIVFRSASAPVYDAMDLGSAQFVRNQINMAFQNAGSYHEAQQMVFRDDLTGLFNMRYLEIALDAECKRARRFKTPVSVLFLDLDYFKAVNDNYGHLMGSKVLREVANVLRLGVREIDSLIRYGGDEFVVILTETGRDGAEHVAERLREEIEEHTFLAREGIHHHLTCCVGVACFPEDAEGPLDLIHLADKAMYRGKETTRNVVYSASLPAEA